ncbi:MAG: MTAP family purine nucleoside phosphorylase [Gammaproteobacteria bacterium AqS3]|nr:MTAP family purine nucleoside phosphorylase [Gammaproteobacteria bacterium AqS3]
MRAAVISGSLEALGGFKVPHWNSVQTAYSPMPVRVDTVQLEDKTEFLHLNRHGSTPRRAPGAINSRAQIDALRRLGVERILALSSVGGIADGLSVGAVVLPDQLIDYSTRRTDSFHPVACRLVDHLDLTEPFSTQVRTQVIESAARTGVAIRGSGTYGCTEGPRLETAAEVRRLRQDGCDLVGMTLLPEAALAAEAGIPYCAISVVVNAAAGLGDGIPAPDKIAEAFQSAAGQLAPLLADWVRSGG